MLFFSGEISIFQKSVTFLIQVLDICNFDRHLLLWLTSEDTIDLFTRRIALEILTLVGLSIQIVPWFLVMLC
jgi:hypothetical protein